MKTLDEILTKKQQEFFLSKDKRLNFLVGSVRSGKTHISLLKFAVDVVATSTEGSEFLFSAKTLTTLKRNCLNPLVTLVGSSNFRYSMSGKEGVLFGRKIYIEGASDETAESKIRGMTLAGAYCDEITLFPESFVTMLLSRLSKPNAKLYATCNPDNPDHYIKKNFIDNDGINRAVWNFLLTDNTFLDKEYLESIVKEYTGVFYERYILGMWVRAEGLVYTKFANNTSDYLLEDDFDYGSIITANIGVDFGGNGSATTFVCTGFTKRFECAIILEAERHEQELSPDELERLYVEFVKRCTDIYGKAMPTYADSAEQILIRGLRNAGRQNQLRTNVFNAKKGSILGRIQLVNKLINLGRFKVNRRCTTVIKALQTAVWNEKVNDERLDDGSTDIDTLDAMEYSIEPYFRELTDYVAR
jgi:PBSX family phage terminase large subunit